MFKFMSTAARAVLGVAVALGAATGAARAADNVHLMLDWIPTGDYAPYYAGIASGIYARNGITLRISRGNGSGDTLSKVAGGAADIGMADISALFTARQRSSVPLKMIGAVYAHSPHSLFVLKDSGITSFSGLEGKKIGITPGNSHRLYFPAVAAAAHTDPSKIEWVTVDGSAMGPLLIAGKIDAMPSYSTNFYYQNKQAQKAGKELAFLPFVEAGFAIYSLAFHTSEATIQKRPEMLRHFMKATLEAWDAARADPQAACEAHVKANQQVDLDDCLGSLKATLAFIFTDHAREAGVGGITAERLKKTYEVVAKAQDLDISVDPQTAVDMSFLPARQ
ncbi:ABC transporter substrate-binding protein [Bosea minatitlanensis]|uniref:ABC transporter substrate-binding protein n=1 Tax=Bosea minatitlanensis TaxID=128782 RepID=A0ABW0F9I6_9HYPH|nr:ABC transporter substrate-binding protein [Bosea minatitlanensis]MCT4494877.1 ABC transporter substrate-binding protein [Bosea minatitlanensis]